MENRETVNLEEEAHGGMSRGEYFDTISSDLKEKINNILWVSLPPETTIKDAEDLACKIHSLILDKWQEKKRR